ncbi:MAG: lantibiotic biosynthesis protein [Actinomycetota bacterium]|nr:lantibiotic biosynthesis protein [Actinomycetota bacterium]
MTDQGYTSGALEPSGFFVLRTPLLPVETWLGGLEAAWLAARPDVADALYLASPTLVDALAEAGGDRARRAQPKLAAYLTRAATRATPFGLFAGCSVGTVATIGGRTHLELCGGEGYRRHTRLDNDYLFALVAALEADPAVRASLRWSPNSSLYRVAGRWRYAEARLDGTLRSYHLVAVDDMDALTQTLARATSGATVDEIATPLMDDDVASEEATAFIEELIDAQLLVSDLQLQVTGPDPTAALVRRLLAHPATAGAGEMLSQVRAALRKIDADGPGAAVDAYRTVADLLANLPAPVERARLFQVDMVKPMTSASLGPGLVAEIGRAIEILHLLEAAATAAGDDALARFRDAFVARFDHREVPLVEVLDEEIGIGFGSDPTVDNASPLLDGLELPPSTTATTDRWTERDDFLLAKILGAAQRGVTEIILDEADLAALGQPDPAPLPDAVEVMVTVAARSVAAVDQGDFRLVVHGVSGAPGARLLARFCHADDTLRDLVVDHLRREEAQQPAAAFAEIVHLPEGRLGNVLCRPVLRAFEIPYLGRSGAPAEAQVPVTDLLVSVGDGRIVLRSQRLDREVVPRLTTAHNFVSGSLGVYRFLCALQSQGTFGGLRWSWGLLARSPFLPRVTCGRLVLARARWTLRGTELESVPRDRLPRFVALVDGDNELACDLDDPSSTEMLHLQLKGRTEATLVEMLPGPDELCVTGPEGRFVHELVVPFTRSGVPRPATTAVRPPAPTSVRRFPPGSGWLYAKLYTGTATADRVLVDAVRPLVDDALAQGVADAWFFVRYGDPDWHVRVRLHGDPAPLLARLHQATAPLLDDGRVWRVQLDTYEREVERYGGDAGVEVAERMFHHDSEAVLAILERLSGDEGLDARWRLALVGTDRLLDDLGFSLEDKAAWAGARRREFGLEFAVDAAATARLGRRYRSERAALEELLVADEDGDHPLTPGLAILARRSEAVAPAVADLRARGLPLPDLAASLAHMHANRLLRSAHRAQELAIHDLLHRLYQARLHRARHG